MTTDAKININFAGKEVAVLAKITYFTQREIALKALQSLGICWAVAAVCVLVPILHFVLTPAAFLAGPIAAAFVYFKVQKLPKFLEGSVRCLHCSSDTDFAFANAKPPFYEMCRNCRTGYEVIWPPISRENS